MRRVFNDRVILWLLSLMSFTIMFSIIIGTILLAISYMTSYIYWDVIVPDGRFNIPVSIIMMMYQITSNVIGILLVLMILYLVSGLVYFRYKG